MSSINKLNGIYKGKTCQIVASGVSQMQLDRKYFDEDCPTIAINLSILRVELLGIKNLFSMQKDGGDYTNCFHCGNRCGDMARPSYATMLVSEHESNGCMPDYESRYVFNAIELFDGKNPYGAREFSANCALKIGQLFGCDKFKLFCFDFHTKKDGRNLYGDTIGNDLKAYFQQDLRMMELIRNDNLEVEWVEL